LSFFDENDRLAEVRFLDDDDSTERKYQYTYDGFGNLVKVDKPDGDDIEYAYNGLNQMTQEKFDANNFNDYEYC
jgi:YD repeat-containing protein